MKVAAPATQLARWAHSRATLRPDMTCSVQRSAWCAGCPQRGTPHHGGGTRTVQMVGDISTAAELQLRPGVRTGFACEMALTS